MRCVCIGGSHCQWIRLCIATCRPGFKSQAHLHYIDLFSWNLSYICQSILKRNKKQKEDGMNWPNLKISTSVIGRFNALWATFQSLLQQLFCPNCLNFCIIFVKGFKDFHFFVKSFLGNLFRHLATFYWWNWLAPIFAQSLLTSVLAIKLVFDAAVS